jgi:hypothetical protein
MVWQTTQVINSTWAVLSHGSLGLRRQYARAAYDDLRTFLGPRGWSAGAEPVPYYPRVHRFYDDNDAVGEDLVIAYQQVHSRYLLKAAEDVLRFERTGLWRKSDPRSQHHHPGGIYWNQNRQFRTANTEAGAIHFALLLYSETHDRAYLQFATQVYFWTRRTLGTPSGAYRQQIGPGGVITGSAFLSADAMMASSGTMLCADTHRARYCAQAQQTAAATARQYGLAKIEQENPVYDSMYFYNTQPSSHVTLGAYVAYLQKLINPKTGLFRWRYRFNKFPKKGCLPSFHCRQEQVAQAGVVGVMALWNRHSTAPHGLRAVRRRL